VLPLPKGVDAGAKEEYVSNWIYVDHFFTFSAAAVEVINFPLTNDVRLNILPPRLTPPSFLPSASAAAAACDC
jgi:hypothetical protein